MPDASARPQNLFTPAFVICLVLLGVTAVAFDPVTRALRVSLAKEAVQLRQPLSRLDKSRLGPYRFEQANTLEPAIVNSLGTEQYIDWVLEDTRYEGTGNPLRYARLFVTYYTGQPDPVPHTPDVCYTGAGYSILEAENTTVTVEALGEGAEVPIRTIAVRRSTIYEGDTMPIIYTFHANGQFAATRNGVRLAVNDPRDAHAYFSKVEVVFGWQHARPRHPKREEAIDATQELFSYLLPLLVEEHWPDWEEVKRAEELGASDNGVALKSASRTPASH